MDGLPNEEESKNIVEETLEQVVVDVVTAGYILITPKSFTCLRLTHSLTYSLTHSPTHLLTHSVN